MHLSLKNSTQHALRTYITDHGQYTQYTTVYPILCGIAEFCGLVFITNTDHIHTALSRKCVRVSCSC